jgi:hypothetical protein
MLIEKRYTSAGMLKIELNCRVFRPKMPILLALIALPILCSAHSAIWKQTPS